MGTVTSVNICSTSNSHLYSLVYLSNCKLSLFKLLCMLFFLGICLKQTCITLVLAAVQ